MNQPAHGVIDLKAYAAGAVPSDDWLAGRANPAFADPGAVVTALAPQGAGTVLALPADEFVIVLSGSLSIVGTQGSMPLPAGRSAVLSAGLQFSWTAVAGTVVVLVTAPGPAGHPARMVPIDATAPLTPSNPPLATLLEGPTPSCRNFTDFRSANGEFVCGTWDSTPYHRRAMTYRHIELMHLLQGSVTFADSGGSSTFHTGDVFVVKRGAECAWISTEHVKKVYAIHRPA